jgi:hypothetical protein
MMHTAAFTRDSIQFTTQASAIATWAKTRWGISYPRSLEFTNGAILRAPRVLHSTFFEAQVIYKAACGGDNGLALCEISVPRRMTWPVLGV